MQINNLYKFFDYFGLPVFTFIFLDALFTVLTGDATWRVCLRLLIGIGGILIDGYLVFFYKKNN